MNNKTKKRIKNVKWPLWDDNEIQFARLICEIIGACEEFPMEEICDSMDLEADGVQELLDRAHEVFEESKRVHCK